MKINKKAFAAPGRYIQGDGVFQLLGDLIRRFGSNPYILMGPTPYKNYSQKATALCEGMNYTLDVFRGYVSIENVEKYMEEPRNHKCDLVVAVGGGKCIDASKMIADKLKIPLIVVPTVASTDAPTSALSVIYSEQGEHICEMAYDRSPDIVLVDTSIIIQAPVRLLIAGMGDALATYFEARACVQSDSFSNLDGYRATITSYAIARECYRVLLADAKKALLAANAGVSTKAFQNIVEVNTLMSGIGAESNGASSAHAFHDGFTVLKETESYYHGERVAFGVLCQLMLENAPDNELAEVTGFLKETGLPITLEDIGIKHVTQDKIRKIAQAVMKSPLIVKEPFEVTEDMVYAAIIAADALGRGEK